MSGSRPPRVLACCDGMVTLGGAAMMTLTALGALVDAGATVHCLLNGWGYEPLARSAERIGATWNAGGSRVRLDRRTRNPLKLARQAIDVLESNLFLAWHVVRFRPTHILVVSHESVLRHYAVLRLSRWWGLRTVMRLCTAPADTPFYRRLWRRWVDPCVDLFVCNSKFTQAEVQACGIAGAKTVQVYNTLPRRWRDAPSVTRSAKVPGRLIYVGQAIPPKGLHVLLDAVAVMARSGVNVSLDVVGDVDGWMSPAYGDYREAVQARLDRPELDGRVRLLGWRDDVIDLMGGAWLHCCPSLPEVREAFGIVVLEAKSAGVPSVVFRSGALPELVTHGVDGWVCESPTAEALADLCCRILADPVAVERAGTAARASAARFDSGTFARAWRTAMGSADGTLA